MTLRSYVAQELQKHLPDQCKHKVKEPKSKMRYQLYMKLSVPLWKDSGTDEQNRTSRSRKLTGKGKGEATSKQRHKQQKSSLKYIDRK